MNFGGKEAECSGLNVYFPLKFICLVLIPKIWVGRAFER